jgi:hypothetical protein
VASSHSGHVRGIGPNREPGRILIPGDGATEDQGLRIGLPARRWRLRDACGLSRLNASWRYGLRRTCRLVTGMSHRPRSTWPDQARLAFPAVTHRYKRARCLWLEQFQIADYELGSLTVSRRSQRTDRFVLFFSVLRVRLAHRGCDARYLIAVASS